jgi:hypothetical protein
MTNWFSIVTIFLCFAAALASLLIGEYIFAIIFVAAVYNIGSWLWLDQFKGLENARKRQTHR